MSALLTPRRQLAFWCLLIAMVVVVGYLPAELIYRGVLYHRYVVRADYGGIVIAEARVGGLRPGGDLTLGTLPPSTSFTLTQYDPQNEPQNRHRVHANNLGWPSRYDYRVEKDPDEFRIAVIGASLTASVTNELFWPDELQRELNANSNLLRQLGVARISVLNLGMQGGLVPQILLRGMKTATRFSPDLVVFGVSTPLLDAFVAEDGLAAVAEMEAAAKASERSRQPVEQPSEWRPADITIDGMEMWLACPTGASGAADPRCRVHPIWYSPPGVAIDKQRFLEIKRDLARHIMLRRIVLTWRPTLLLTLLGQPPVAEPIGAAPPPLETQRGNVPVLVEIFSRARSIHPNVIFTHDPVLWNPVDRHGPPLFFELAAAAKTRGLDYVRVADQMPLQVSETEWRRWYLWDGHWSDQGAPVFAKALARIIEKRTLAARGITSDAKQPNCAGAYEDFERALRLQEQGHNTGALKLLASAAARLPLAAQSSARPGTEDAERPYAECGFVADLYTQRWLLVEQQGDLAASEEAFSAVLAIVRDPTALYEKRAASRVARGDHKGAISDQTELIALHPDRIDPYNARANSLTAVQQYVAALKDIEVVLKAKPDDEPALYLRCQLRSLTGDPKGVIADADRLLKRHPGNPAFIYLRAGAFLALNELDLARSELETLASVEPNHPALTGYRAELQRRTNEVAARKTFPDR